MTRREWRLAALTAAITIGTVLTVLFLFISIAEHFK